MREIRGGQADGQMLPPLSCPAPVSQGAFISQRGFVPQRAFMSRRAFVEGAAVLAGAATILSFAAPDRGAIETELTMSALPEPRPEFTGREVQAVRTGAAARAPVVTFYMDRPYLDPTGTGEAYLPPAGARSGQPLAELSDAEFLRRHPYSVA